MKINGRKIEGPQRRIVPIIRREEDGGNFFFVVEAITDMTPFNLICPLPEPPKITLPGGKFKHDIEDPGYRDELDRWLTKRGAWIVLKCLAPSNIEWDSVDMHNPDTYVNWITDMGKAGLSEPEMRRLTRALNEVNDLTEDLIEEARKSFLTGAGTQGNVPNSPTAALTTTPSGDVALKSESDRPVLKA